MESDLKALEEKLGRLVESCRQLRSENLGLRQALAQSQDEARQLKDNMQTASARLQVLIEHLPEELS